MSDKNKENKVTVRLDSNLLALIQSKLDNNNNTDKNLSVFIRKAIEFYINDIDYISIKFNKIYDNVFDLAALLQNMRDMKDEDYTDEVAETLTALEKCEAILCEAPHKKRQLASDDDDI